MSIKKLFEKNRQTTVVNKYLKNTNISTAGAGLESAGHLSESIKKRSKQKYKLGTCEICGASNKKLKKDICQNCDKGIRNFKYDIDILKSAVLYLET